MNSSSQPPALSAPAATAGAPQPQPGGLQLRPQRERGVHRHRGLAGEVGLVEAEQRAAGGLGPGEGGRVGVGRAPDHRDELDAGRGDALAVRAPGVDQETPESRKAAAVPADFQMLAPFRTDATAGRGAAGLPAVLARGRALVAGVGASPSRPGIAAAVDRVVSGVAGPASAAGASAEAGDGLGPFGPRSTGTRAPTVTTASTAPSRATCRRPGLRGRRLRELTLAAVCHRTAPQPRPRSDPVSRGRSPRAASRPEPRTRDTRVRRWR